VLASEAGAASRNPRERSEGKGETMSFDKTLAALEQYEPKELTAFTFFAQEGGHAGLCCAIGAVVPRARELVVKHTGLVHVGAAWDYDWRFREQAEALGLTENEATTLQQVNDYYSGSPDERYEHVVLWLRNRVAAEQCGGAK
jgi:hypothetical protein